MNSYWDSELNGCAPLPNDGLSPTPGTPGRRDCPGSYWDSELYKCAPIGGYTGMNDGPGYIGMNDGPGYIGTNDGPGSTPRRRDCPGSYWDSELNRCAPLGGYNGMNDGPGRTPGRRDSPIGGGRRDSLLGTYINLLMSGAGRAADLPGGSSPTPGTRDCPGSYWDSELNRCAPLSSSGGYY
jgi:hypothetical protein